MPEAETPDTQPEPEPKPQTLGSRRESPEEKAWHDYIAQEQKDTPKRLEEVAKFLSGLYGISFTIMLSANGEVFKHNTSYFIPMACVVWLISLFCCLLCIFPFPWAYRGDSAKSISDAHKRLVRFKYAVLLGSLALYVFALGLWLRALFAL